MTNDGVVIRGGRVIDPANGIDSTVDVFISEGKIVSVGAANPSVPPGTEEFDARGCVVTPGWIDLHTHLYEHATTLGVNPDKYCLYRGVTTAVDGGSSGAMTFAGLRHFIAKDSATRVLAFLHVATHGLAGAACSGALGAGLGGESDHLNAINKELCLQGIRRNRDMIVGVKVRLDRSITDGGRTEHETYMRALEVSEEAEVPLMVHHTCSSIPLEATSLSCPGSMRRGDIYTHVFHGHESSIFLKEKSVVCPSVVAAQKDRGVIMDAGHGQGSFDWKVAEAAASVDFWPDTISTDLHSGNVRGTVKDLAHVMSKFLHLGMPIEKVVRCVTMNPASAIRRGDEIGDLSVGREADVTVFRLDESRKVKGEDAFKVVREMGVNVVPVVAFRKGKKFVSREN